MQQVHRRIVRMEAPSKPLGPVGAEEGRGLARREWSRLDQEPSLDPWLCHFEKRSPDPKHPPVSNQQGLRNLCSLPQGLWVALGRSLPNEDPTPRRKLRALDKMPCKALSSSDRTFRSLGMPGVQVIPTSRRDEAFAVQRVSKESPLE